ncbi:MAG: helix-turn-helix domain-containing protein [Nitrososphaerales archaeon]
MSKIKDEIVLLLSAHPQITVSEIARRLNLSRTTVIKYLKLLGKESLIGYRKVGSAKLVFLRGNEAEREARKAEAKKKAEALSREIESFLQEGFALEILDDREAESLRKAREILKGR